MSWEEGHSYRSGGTCRLVNQLPTPSISGVHGMITKATDEEKLEQLSDLGKSYLDCFDRLGEVTDIDKAIECNIQVVQLTPDDHEHKPRRLSRLRDAYQCRFERLRKVADIDKAIECASQATMLTPDSHADRSGLLCKLGVSYRHRFDCLGNPTDIGEAINCLVQGLRLTPETHPGRAQRWSSLGNSYGSRFDWLGELVDINQAIDCHMQAVQLTADSHTDKPSLLNSLGTSYNGRFECIGELLDNEKAIECINQAVQLTPDGHPQKPLRLNNLGCAYESRYCRLGELEDIDKSIECKSQAMVLTPDDHAIKPAIVGNLGLSYMCRFEHLGELVDIDKAVEYEEKALELTSDGHEIKAYWLNNLGNSYIRRFVHLGEHSDIHKAIDCLSQAVKLTPDGHKYKPSRINNLGSSYLCRFEYLGELTDIDKAIDCIRRAAQFTPDGRADKPRWLNNLGMSYFRRFECLGELLDIAKSIEWGSQALALTPDDHPDRPKRFNNLGNSYQSRFERLGELPDIDQAIDYHSQGAVLTPDSHKDKPTLLNNLGNSYRRRFEHLGKVPDIDKALDYNRQAVQLTPDVEVSKPGRLNSLGHSLHRRFELLGEIADIEEAIHCMNQAVQLTPDSHATKPSWIFSLGLTHERRFEHLGEFTDLETAFASFQRAAQLAVTNPRVQFKSARYWAKSSLVLGTSPGPAYQRAMELVPQLIWLGRTIEQRYDLLPEIGDLAMDAAAWAISDRACDIAVEWLEAGRSIIWNQILQLRTPFDDLEAVNPALAQRLKDAGRELERAGTRSQSAVISQSTNNPPGLEQEAEHHRSLAAQWDQLLEEARLLPQFQDFMRPRRAKALTCAAKDGPIVLVNVHSTRCDALIIMPNSDNVAHVPLENFSLETAADCREQLISSIGDRGGRTRGLKLGRVPDARSRFVKMLATLWSSIVGPVLDFLGYTSKPPTNPLPHVTWCTTGTLSFLPLHAAGCYNGLQPNAPDLVVSSYTPTLSALLATATSAHSQYGGVLAVGQEHTIGFRDLPNTVPELDAIRVHAKASGYLQLDSDKATVDTVLNAMDEYSWVHLACHATQRAGDPTQSAFHLHDGNLVLSTITKRSFKNKGLAFLSACQTAKGDEKLPDEAVHLAAGMLMAGYPSVIATMWGIDDTDAPEVARQVYADLLKDGKMDCTGASRALHKAVAGLRERVGEKSFERWVPFIHIGA